jgi:hypothetical protein
MLIIAVLIAVSTPPRPAFAFDTWWHAEATRHGVVANGFSADARLDSSSITSSAIWRRAWCTRAGGGSPTGTMPDHIGDHS